jgi:DNA-binding transcriptional ArsR family regulator
MVAKQRPCTSSSPQWWAAFNAAYSELRASARAHKQIRKPLSIRLSPPRRRLVCWRALAGPQAPAPRRLTLILAIWLDSDMADDEASVFRALADPTRRQILQDLRGGELSAGEIASRFPIKGPSVSRHLAILKGAELIRERRDANRILYSLVEDRLALCVGGFLSAVCPEQVVIRRRRPAKGTPA